MSVKVFIIRWKAVERSHPMARDFYPFVEESAQDERQTPVKSDALTLGEVTYPARIAVYDDAAAAPRVVIVDPSDVRSYLEEITATVNRLVREQGGSIPFMVIREIVENFIHAYFISPTISILDGGNTIRFSDQGPGIREKERALEYGTTSATEDMKRYIRGVGSGLPYVQQYMVDKGGSLVIEDNITSGTVVTISTRTADEASVRAKATERDSNKPQVDVVKPNISLSQRAMDALEMLKSQGSVGPSDLVRDLGSSAATWSRELKRLQDQGLAKKTGQKYQLTDVGKAFLD